MDWVSPSKGFNGESRVLGILRGQREFGWEWLTIGCEAKRRLNRLG